jgi:hypothetical protein
MLMALPETRLLRARMPRQTLTAAAAQDGERRAVFPASRPRLA